MNSVDSTNGIKRKLRDDDDDDESIEMKEEMEVVVRDDSCPKRVKSDDHRSLFLLIFCMLWGLFVFACVSLFACRCRNEMLQLQGKFSSTQ